MAPKGGVKRAAASVPTEEPEAKRVAEFLKQQDVSESSYQPVLDVLQHPLANLSESVRAFVLSVLPWSLAVPADERSELQASSVSMVDAIVQAVQAELQQKVDAEKERIDELEATRAELDSAVEQTEAAKTEAKQAVEERAAAVAEADATVTQKRAAHKDCEVEEKRLADDLEQTRGQKSALEEALSNGFEKLKDGSCEEGEAEGLAAAVIATAKRSSLEESMITALAVVFKKRERGSFDVAVIQEAEQGFRSKIAALSEVIEAAADQLAAQTAAVQAAQAELDAATAEQAEAAEALRAARDTSTTAVVAAQAAKDAVRELDAKLVAPTAAKGQRNAELQRFRDSNVSMFEFLRDRVSKQHGQELAQDPAEAASKESVGDKDTNVAAPLAGA